MLQGNLMFKKLFIAALPIFVIGCQTLEREQIAATVVNAYQQADHLVIHADLTRHWSSDLHYLAVADMRPDETLVTVYDASSPDTPIEKFIKKRGKNAVGRKPKGDTDRCLYGSFTEDSWIGRNGSLQITIFSNWIRDGHFIGFEKLDGNRCAVFLYIREELGADYYRREDKLFVDMKTKLINKWVYGVYNDKDSDRPYMTSTKVYSNNLK